jgi:S-disulfanyl-L-cysteine oxidoreductase SoxD
VRPHLGLPVLLAAALACRAEPPGPLETAVANRIKHGLTVRGGSDRSPLPASPEVIRRGQRAFGSYCTACHGLDGEATGVPFAAAMSPPVPRLGSAEVQAYSDGQLHWVIENGLWPSGMPAARGILGEEEIWSIVAFLRHLPPEGSLGEPPWYAGGDETTGSPVPSGTGPPAGAAAPLPWPWSLDTSFIETEWSSFRQIPTR